MRVAIDGRPLVGDRTGIGVHVAEIVGRLREITPIIFSHAAINNREGIGAIETLVDQAPLGVLWQQFLFSRAAADRDCGVVWGPHGTLPWTLKIPSVITVHDLTSITMPRQHKLSTILSFNLFINRSLSLASRIAAVSRVTADEVSRGFGIPVSRIEIVPNCVSGFFTPAYEPARLPDGIAAGSYLLYVGTVEPRKGIAHLVAAWQSLAEPRPPLVIAGGAGWKNSRLRSGIEPHIASGSIKMTGFVDRETLRELYRHCLLFIYPSLYEGFGLPPLEAMACGAPVIASRAGAIPEVAGTGAELFEPGDAEDLAVTIRRLLRDPILRSDLQLRGLERASQCRWEESAALMEELFKGAAGG